MNQGMGYLLNQRRLATVALRDIFGVMLCVELLTPVDVSQPYHILPSQNSSPVLASPFFAPRQAKRSDPGFNLSP